MRNPLLDLVKALIAAAIVAWWMVKVVWPALWK